MTLEHTRDESQDGDGGNCFPNADLPIFKLDRQDSLFT